MGEEEQEVTFSSFGLDDRILKSISDLGWSKPTLVQERFIPLALDGKDIVARARTGCGKTGAFAVPLVQKILRDKTLEPKQFVRALVMAPTKELCRQVADHISKLCSCCSREILLIDIASQSEDNATKLLQSELPDIVVSTPYCVSAQLNKSLSLKLLQILIVDEADLIFSLGYEQEIKEIVSSLPESYQAFLTSATMNDDVKALKKLLLHNAVTLKLEEAQLPDVDQLTQYHIKCKEEDKFVLVYALIKLRLVRGKSILFVKETDRCYRLKLFLEQFGIPSCVLNSEMPINSRCHIVQQFNDGFYDYIIASDDSHLYSQGETSESGEPKKKRKRRDKEFGVSRGIDFHRVANVINFDFPQTVEQYIHRVGRTARGWNRGTALSFATEDEGHLLEEVENVLNEQMGSDVLKPYEFRMEELDGFRYRARDVMKAVTSSAVREARLGEIRDEILRSKRLNSYFDKNPRERDVLRHDKVMHTIKRQQHLEDVPDYIVPETLKGMNYSAPLGCKKREMLRKMNKMTRGRRKFEKKQSDPLKNFDCLD